MTGVKRGLVMLALREIEGTTAFLAGKARGAMRLSEDDPDEALATGLLQLHADLKTCQETASSLIERLGRTPKEIPHETAT